MNINVSEIPNFFYHSLFCLNRHPSILPSEEREFCSNNNYAYINPAKASIERIQYLYSNLIIVFFDRDVYYLGFVIFSMYISLWSSLNIRTPQVPYPTLFCVFRWKEHGYTCTEKKKKTMVNFFLFVCKVEDRVHKYDMFLCTEKWSQ